MGYRLFARLASVCFTILFLCLIPGPAVWADNPDEGIWIGRTDQGHVFYFTTDRRSVREIGIRYEVSNEQCSKLSTDFVENTENTPLQDGGFVLSKVNGQGTIEIQGTFVGSDYCTGTWKAEDGNCGWAGEGTWYAGSAEEAVDAATKLVSNSNARSGLGQGREFDVYSVTVPVNDRLTLNDNDIQMTVSTIGETDTVGILFGQDLKSAIAYDDESGETGNFRISELLPAGLYYLVVIGYKEDTSGDYDVFVTII